jgi:hypothetical protein
MTGASARGGFAPKCRMIRRFSNLEVRLLLNRICGL